MEKVYGIMRYQNSVQVAEITEHVKLNWDYICTVSDDIPDGRGNGKCVVEFNNMLGRFKIQALIRYDWNCREAIFKNNGGDWISALRKPKGVCSHKTFIKAIIEMAIIKCGFPPYTKVTNLDEDLNFPSLIVKRILDDANSMRIEEKIYTGANFVLFTQPSNGNCFFETSSDILRNVNNNNGGAICFYYKQPYLTDDGRILDNYHTKYYLIGPDKTIKDVFEYKCFNWTIRIKEKWGSLRNWLSYFPSFIISDLKGHYIETELFESDKALFNFFIQLVNLIDEETTIDEIKDYIYNYDSIFGYSKFIKNIVRNNHAK